jgi:hypothetical protein
MACRNRVSGVFVVWIIWDYYCKSHGIKTNFVQTAKSLHGALFALAIWKEIG